MSRDESAVVTHWSVLLGANTGVIEGNPGDALAAAALHFEGVVDDPEEQAVAAGAGTEGVGDSATVD